jgi:hypothetical protein
MSNRGPSKVKLLEMLDAEREVADEAVRALAEITRLTGETMTDEIAKAALRRVTILREAQL